MPEQPTIIQNSNQQNNDGCGTGCGTGCLVIVVAAILLWPISMVGAAMEGDAAGWWIPIGILLTLVEIVLIGGLAFAWMDRKFGWGYMDGLQATEQNPSANTIPPEDLAGEASNYGVATDADAEKKPADKKERFGRRVPHPDDPSPSVSGPVRGIGQQVNPPPEPSARKDEIDVYERLRRLKELLDEGHLSQEEYDTKKQELLKLL